MAIHAHKRGEESNDSLMQRFKKQTQKSGLVKLLRERSVRRKEPSKRLVRLRALKRENFRAEKKKTQFYSNM